MGRRRTASASPARTGEPEATSAQPKRPVSVTLVAVLALVVTAYSLTFGILGLRSGDPARLPEHIFRTVLGAGALVAAVGAFRMRPWAWAAFMCWAVIGLTHQILRYGFFGNPNYLDMAINAFAVLALSPLDVQIAFGLRHTENVQLARPTRNPVDSR